jgi:hypothetical protein
MEFPDDANMIPPGGHDALLEAFYFWPSIKYKQKISFSLGKESIRLWVWGLNHFLGQGF